MTYSSCGNCQYVHSTTISNSYMSSGLESKCCNASDYNNVRSANNELYGN